METIPLPLLGPEFEGTPSDKQNVTPLTQKKRGRPRKVVADAPTESIQQCIFEKGEKQRIVKNFLKPDVEINWPLELRTFNTLLKRYPKVEFWRTFALNYKVHSILWFVGQGKKDVERAYFLFGLDWKAKEHKIEGNEKIGEDYKPSVKKPTLLELLKN